MFFPVFQFELQYRLRRPATYIYFFVLLALTALIVGNGGILPDDGESEVPPVGLSGVIHGGHR